MLEVVCEVTSEELLDEDVRAVLAASPLDSGDARNGEEELEDLDLGEEEGEPHGQDS